MEVTFEHTRIVWDRSGGMEAATKIVLLALADMADKAGRCWPSTAVLAERTGLCERAVRTKLAALETAGIISRARRRRRNGSLGVYDTDLHLDALQATDAVRPPAADAAQEETTSEQTSTSSLRSEAAVQSQVTTQPKQTRATVTAQGVEAARQYVDTYRARTGQEPVSPFQAIRAVCTSLVKAGYEPDEIVDAMLASRVMSAKAVQDEIVRRRQSDRGSGPAIPATVVRAVLQAKGWLAERAPALNDQEAMVVVAWFVTHTKLQIGETMLRLAVAVRAWHGGPLEDLRTGMWRAQVTSFAGDIADYPDAMERAYRNQFWRAS